MYDYSSNTHNFDVLLTRIGNQLMVVSTDPYLDGTPSYWVIPQPMTLQVTPGPARKFSLFDSSTIYQASTPSSFVLQVYDVYGNPTTANHTFSISFIGNDNAYRFSIKHSWSDPVNGTSTIKFLNNWEGSFSLLITLIPLDNKAPDIPPTIYPIIFLPATCAGINPSKPIRCYGTTNCTSTYANCPGGSPTPCNYACGLATCPSSFDPCCVGGLTYCASTASCAPTCAPPTDCPLGTNLCATSSQCSLSASDCPSPQVCPLGAILCADGHTCSIPGASTCSLVLSLLSTPCPLNFPYRCPTGTCVRNNIDCPTPVSCGPNSVLCSDGSCQTSQLNCPTDYPCQPEVLVCESSPSQNCKVVVSSNTFRCSDGSCRADPSQCPTAITCWPGEVKCPSGYCAPTLAQCTPVQICSLNQTRCPSGSCQDNLNFCPTTKTCSDPLKPIRCTDDSCVSTIYDCPRASACSGVTCPGGYCKTSFSLCPTLPVCPFDKPLLCSDAITCASNATQCSSPFACPLEAPFRCPDGSCRLSSSSCPSSIQCPSTQPYKCPDNECAIGLDECYTTIKPCLSPTSYRCPITNQCAQSWDQCGTPVTCSSNTMLCQDQTCHLNCNDVAIIPCPVISCTTVGGQSCANSPLDCPTQRTCAIGELKCFDGSCQLSLSQCPPFPTTTTSKSPCPDGSWSDSGTPCPQGITCPLTSPIICWDNTCRKIRADCPIQPICSPSTPYLCPYGGCVNVPWSQDCSAPTSISTCPKEMPVRCPTGCFAHVENCTDPIFGCTDPNGCTTCDPVSHYLCYDGSCVTKSNAAKCPRKKCPNIMCPNGYCVTLQSDCDSRDPGWCPPEFPVHCPRDGLCKPTFNACNITDTCKMSGVVLSPDLLPTTCDQTCLTNLNNDLKGRTFSCTDGSCAVSTTSCPTVSGCSMQFPNRCSDGTCVADFLECTGCIPGSVCPAFTQPLAPNVCPSGTPYQCDSGYCAKSSLFCPPMFFTCNFNHPIPCADGTCRDSISQCPVIKPCSQSEQRCGDGTCRLIGSCAVGDWCPSGTRRCWDGLCIPKAQICGTVDGCPLSLPIRCQNQMCVSNSTQCVLPISPTGCPPNFVQCFDGSCKNKTDFCNLENGCPTSQPFRCSSNGQCFPTQPASCPTCVGTRCGDGSCQANAADCTNANGCPVKTPYRCGDGTCSKFAANSPGGSSSNKDKCSPVVVCQDGQTICPDGMCVSNSNNCKLKLGCEPQQLCSDFSCHDSCVGVVLRSCPLSAPILCTTGTCVSSFTQCPSTFGGPTISATQCPSKQQKCADGACHKSCAENALAAFVATGQTFDLATGNVNLLCDVGLIMCSNGLCETDPNNCPIIQACPDKTYRCKNGTCSATLASCENNLVKNCDKGLIRSVDGLCRPKPLPYDGCPNNGNTYSCLRECISSDTKCITTPGRRLLQDTDPMTPCYTNCYAQIKAIQMDLTVSTITSTSAVIALDNQKIPVMTIKIPGGAFLERNITGSGTVDAMTTISFDDVAESDMRTAIHNVHPSRYSPDIDTLGRGLIAYPKTLTFAQTVVSPAFRCKVPPNIEQPFRLEITVESIIDTGRSDGTDTWWYQDICLGHLIVRGESTIYSWWECVFTDSERRIFCLEGDTGCQPGTHPLLYDAKDNSVTSSIQECILFNPYKPGDTTPVIYTYINSPIATYQAPPNQNPNVVSDNLIAIVLGVVGTFVFLIMLIYFAFRLYRYREKYHKERDEAKVLKEEVDNMTQHGTAGARVDDQVQMNLNPLASTLPVTQPEDAKLLEAEVKLREQNDAIRKAQIEQMQRDKERLAAQVAEMQLQATNEAPKGPTREIEDDRYEVETWDQEN